MIPYNLKNIATLLETKEDILGCPNCNQLTVGSEMTYRRCRDAWDEMIAGGALFCNNCDEHNPTHEDDLEIFIHYNSTHNYYQYQNESNTN